ncbi:MAG: RNA polymerase sigma factor [Planctomycetota bacterium]
MNDVNTTTLKDPKDQVLEVLPRLYTMAHYNFKDPKDAEDATQEAALKILSHWNTFRGEAPREHWMLKIAFTTIRSHQRSRSSRERTMTGYKDECLERMEESPSTTIIREEDRARLHHAVQSLPEDLRESVILSYFHKLTQTQIASVLDCTQKTVSVRLEKALGLLRTRLAMSVVPLNQLMDSSTLAPVPAALKTKIITAMASAPVGVGAVATGTLIKGALLMNTKWIIGASVCTVIGITAGYEGAQHMGVGTTPPDNQATVSMEHSRHSALIQEVEAKLKLAQSERNKVQAELESMRTLHRVAEETKSKLEKRLALLESAAKAAPVTATAQAPKAPSEEQAAKAKALLEETTLILKALESGGSNSMQEGMKLISVLGKFSHEDYEILNGLDAESDDPQMHSDIYKLMVFSAAMAPNPSKEAINISVERLLERLEKGEGYPEPFQASALDYMTWSNPVTKAYVAVSGKLTPELNARLTRYAFDCVRQDANLQKRRSGLGLLVQARGPEAIEGLQYVVREKGWGDPDTLQAAYRGLGGRKDAKVLEFLRNESSATADPELKKIIEEQIVRTEQALK